MKSNKDLTEEIVKKLILGIPNYERLSREEQVRALVGAWSKTESILVEKIAYLTNWTDSFKFLLLGLFLGTLGNLWASLIYDSLKGNVFLYLSFLFLITLGTLVFISNLAINKLDKTMSERPIIKSLWDEWSKKSSK